MTYSGLVSGFIGVRIHVAIQRILQDINIANRCRKELASMKNLVMTIEPVITQIQQYRLAFNESKDKASDVNRWLTELDVLLLQASEMVQWCTIPRSGVISSYKKGTRINSLISDITEHLNMSPLLPQTQLPEAGHSWNVVDGLWNIKDSLEVLASSAITPRARIAPRGTSRLKLIDEPLIVGQEKAIASLEKLVIDDADARNIGVVGKSGSGKTLLMKTVFNAEKVHNHFQDGLLLWLTVSQCHSVPIVTNKLCTQIAIQTKVELDSNMKDENLKIWVAETRVLEKKRIALFLDDVGEEEAAELLEGLGILRLIIDQSNSKVIVSSRDRSALLQLGVAEKYTITVKDLTEDESWMLFASHAFPSNYRDCPNSIEEKDLPVPCSIINTPANFEEEKAMLVPCNERNPPENIDWEKAKLVSQKCGGIPLAIKVVGRAMAGNTHPQQWEWALHRLANACSLNDCLRLSFDALGNEEFDLQLCFLQVATAFLEDEIIDAEEVIPFWIGEGLLARKMLQNEPVRAGSYDPLKMERVVDLLEDRCLIEPMMRNIDGRLVCLRMQDPFEIGSIYVSLLAERCLIEPTVRGRDGRVVRFRMLNVLRDLAIGIANQEQNFYCLVGSRLTALHESEALERNRLLLSHNKLTSLPQFESPRHIRSLLISQNPKLTKIPEKVMGSLIFLTLLDLSGTSIQLLPKSVGSLKQIVCLRLLGVPINKLPKSVTNLVHLEILDLSFSSIRKLPSGLHMMRSLRYLGLHACKNLQYLPYNIGRVMSLQYLHMDAECNVWTKRKAKSWYRKVASLHNLGSLVQLKRLTLRNNGEIIEEGILGRMIQMDTVHLIFTEIKELPSDMHLMSKLKSLSLKCSHLVEMKNVSEFRNLNYLKFYECSMLEEISYLQNLPSLRQLEIILCPKVKSFPQEFGEEKAFPSLKIFSLVGLHNLEQLVTLKENAFSSLQILTIMDCPALKILPKTYLNLKTLQKIRLYGCSTIIENSERVNEESKILDMISMSIDTEKVIKEYLQLQQRRESWLYGEFWCDELFSYIKAL